MQGSNLLGPYLSVGSRVFRLHGAECSEQHGQAFDVGKIHGYFEYR